MLGAFCKLAQFVKCAAHFVNSQRFRVRGLGLELGLGLGVLFRGLIRDGARVKVRD